MIISELNGGLGNQLFQYALGKNLALKNKTELFIELKNFNTNIRKYSLGFFNLSGGIITNEELKRRRLPNMCKNDLFSKLKRKTHKTIEKLYPPHKRRLVVEGRFTFNPEILKIRNKKPIYLIGNWQSEKYFLDIEDTIRNEFTLKEKTSDEFNQIEEKIKKSNSISLHIRRGDYITNKKTNSFHGTCSLDYYNKATDIIKEKIENPTFFIFSDDINWVRKNFKTNSTTIFVSHEKLKDYEELILMSKCQHNIIANSSFSWWGAWLNNNSQKIIIAPKRWFNNSGINTTDLIPNNWIKI